MLELDKTIVIRSKLDETVMKINKEIFELVMKIIFTNFQYNDFYNYKFINNYQL